ncbi:MAG: hypothetical protein B6D58_04685 [candidate division Zixibacteria bacterium 4484_95]|nr:MAG: hypothetical protein B6D58_04685 [candidate division Zixibacteria bacterium 4484_95]
MPIDEFANEFGVEVIKGDFDTVGGMVVTKLGKIPAFNDVISFKGFNLRVTEKDGHKIKTFFAKKTNPNNS